MNKVIEKNKILHVENLSTKYGLWAGLAMSLYLLSFQLTGNDYSPGYKSFMYIFLFLAISVGLYKLSKAKKGPIFAKGIFTGMQLSFIASSMVAILNLLLYLIAPEYAFSKYGMEPSNVFQALIIGSILFIEIFVMGNILSFINMQYLKRETPQ